MTGTTASFTGAADEPMACTFTNKRAQAVPTIVTAATPTGGPIGTSISDTATVSGGHTPSGTVTFHLYAPGDTTCTTAVFTSSDRPLSAGSATSGAFSSAVVGTYEWTATYGGDTNNTSVSSVCGAEPVAIAQAVPTIVTAATPTGGPIGTSISDTATVSGGHTPSGTVTFHLYAPGDTTCTTAVFTSSDRPLSAGSATSGAFSSAVVGTYEWTATYGGDTNNTSVSSVCGAEPVAIAQAVPTIVTAATPTGGPIGTSISDTATVSGGHTPSGTVTFHLYAPGDTTCTTAVFTSSDRPLSAGSATSGAFSSAVVGTYEWTATYGGDTNNTSVSSVCGAEPVAIAQAVPTIVTAATPTGGPIGTSISDTATVSGGHTPSGTVTFHLYAPGDTTCTTAVFTSSDRPLSAGSATSGAFSSAVVGTYEWTATYGGDTNNTSVSSVCGAEPVAIAQAVPTIVTAATPTGGPIGTSISDTATVSGGHTPSGTVTFHLYAPGDTTCTTAVFTSSDRPLSAGSATSGAFSSAVVGTYEWTATYGGDTNNTSVSSVCGAEPVAIAQAVPTIVTAATPTGGPIGTSISDTATVSGGHTPSGTVTFHLYAPGDTTCTTAVFTSSDRPLSAGSATSGASRVPWWAPTSGRPPTAVTPTTRRSARSAGPNPSPSPRPSRPS